MYNKQGNIWIGPIILNLSMKPYYVYDNIVFIKLIDIFYIKSTESSKIKYYLYVLGEEAKNV